MLLIAVGSPLCKEMAIIVGMISFFTFSLEDISDVGELQEPPIHTGILMGKVRRPSYG
jgi:hypothetical protein